MKKITFLVIFSLIVMVVTTTVMQADSDDATATVKVWTPLKIDPKVPNSDGMLYPNMFFRSDESVTYTVQDASSWGTRIPYAQFGLNGDFNEWVYITYSTAFANGTTGIECIGGWYWYKISQAGTVEYQSLAIDQNLNGLTGNTNAQLNGKIPSLILDPNEYTGGLMMNAYVKSMTITPNATTNAPGTHNSIIFTITAAYLYY